MSIEQLASQLRAMRIELAEDNDRAEERAMLERAMKMNERTFRNTPRTVRNYGTDSVAVYCGEEKTV